MDEAQVELRRVDARDLLQGDLGILGQRVDDRGDCLELRTRLVKTSTQRRVTRVAGVVYATYCSWLPGETVTIWPLPRSMFWPWLVIGWFAGYALPFSV